MTRAELERRLFRAVEELGRVSDDKLAAVLRLRELHYAKPVPGALRMKAAVEAEQRRRIKLEV